MSSKPTKKSCCALQCIEFSFWVQCTLVLPASSAAPLLLHFDRPNKLTTITYSLISDVRFAILSRWRQLLKCVCVCVCVRVAMCRIGFCTTSTPKQILNSLHHKHKIRDRVAHSFWHFLFLFFLHTTFSVGRFIIVCSVRRVNAATSVDNDSDSVNDGNAIIVH